ncbi:MAG TPA: hypothetical protein VNN74_11230 [Candidatus Micrarchaeia archaeon]|nr:hypothetical protein [Candidatus Micrarchaeia archaeon]
MAAGLTGEILATRTLARGDGAPVAAVVVRPDDTDANRAALRQVSARWQRQAQGVVAIDHAAAHRAFFASDVAFIASGELAGDPDTQMRVVQGASGPVLGLALYRFLLIPRPRWYIGLVTVRPEDQPGFPGALPARQIRGTGRFLTEAVLDDIATNPTCTRIELDCLDAAACSYWRHIGFAGTTEPLTLSCEEARRVAVGLFPIPLDPEDVQAGTREAVSRVNPRWG